MNSELFEIGKIQVDPDDVILVRVNVGKTVTDPIRSYIREQFQAAFPKNKVIVYDNETLDIKIYKALEIMSNKEEK